MKLRTQLRTHTLAQALFYACFLGIYALGNGLTFFALAFFVGTFAEEIAQWYWLYRIKFTGHLVVQLASWALLFTAVASTLLRTIPYFLAISPLVAIALTIAVVKVLQPLGLHKLILRNNL